MAYNLNCLTRKLIARRRAFFAVVAVAAAFYLCYQVLSIRKLGEQLSSDANIIKRNDLILPEMRFPSSSSAKPGKWTSNKQNSGIKIRGVRPEDVALYIPTSRGNFLCIHANNEEIAYNHVNDDYCDCPDGSDEPSTSACPNGRFFCEFEPPSSKHVAIASSKVNDGVCDCCDGSDEWENAKLPPLERIDESMQRKIGRYQVPCGNTCVGRTEA